MQVKEDLTQDFVVFDEVGGHTTRHGRTHRIGPRSRQVHQCRRSRNQAVPRVQTPPPWCSTSCDTLPAAAARVTDDEWTSRSVRVRRCGVKLA